MMWSYEIYAYEIAQSLSKFIFLLLGCRYLDIITQNFLPTLTNNGFCSHLQKKFLNNLDPPLKHKDIHIKKFFLLNLFLPKP